MSKQDKKVMVKMTFPLPSSNWVRGANGAWYTTAWTKEEKALAEMDRYVLIDQDVITRRNQSNAWKLK